MARTRRVDTSGPGIHRVGRGRGFSFHEEDGERITDAATVERIRGLAIPPAWQEVWICPHPRGHIQATGIDDAGRKQYIYHDDWRVHRDRLKFEEMLDFAARLPTLRERLDEDLRARGLVERRVLACAVRLLDLGLFRVGNERYESENESYGLTTLRRTHVSIVRGEALFDYPSKSGQRSTHTIDDASVMPTLRALRKRRGGIANLLVHKTPDGWHPVDSDDVNAYIKETVGEEFSAKDFRTWNATVIAAVTLAHHAEGSTSKASRKRIANLAVRETAEFLKNTPAVCRASYIDPRVFDRFDDGDTIAPAMERIDRRTGAGEFAEREAIEGAVRELLS